MTRRRLASFAAALRSRRGQSLTEYVLLLSLISMVVTASVAMFGTVLSDAYMRMASELANLLSISR